MRRRVAFASSTPASVRARSGQVAPGCERSHGIAHPNGHLWCGHTRFARFRTCRLGTAYWFSSFHQAPGPALPRFLSDTIPTSFENTHPAVVQLVTFSFAPCSANFAAWLSSRSKRCSTSTSMLESARKFGAKKRTRRTPQPECTTMTRQKHCRA